MEISFKFEAYTYTKASYVIDRFLLPWQAACLRPPACWLKHRGVRADQVSFSGLAIGVLAGGAIAENMLMVGFALILANRFLDGLDGALARIQGITDRGAFLDIAFDFFFYALIPLGFGLANPANNSLAALVLLASFIGSGSSFLAFATIAGKRGMNSTAFPQKGIYYLGGLTEGAETIFAFGFMCFYPSHFANIAYVFAGLASATTIMRWAYGWKVFAP